MAATAVSMAAPAKLDFAVRTSKIFVLIVAHPDDESMFFMPWLNSMRILKQQQQQPRADNQSHTTEPTILVWILCLTTGDYNGKGPMRRRELERLVASHTLCSTVVDALVILDEPTIASDHPTRAWNVPDTAALIARTLSQAWLDYSSNNNNNSSNSTPPIPTGATAQKKEERESTPATTKISTTRNHWHFVTFDEYGVSGHVNHRNTFYAVRHVVLQQQQQRYPSENTGKGSRLDNVHTTIFATDPHAMTVWTLESIQPNNGNVLVQYIPVEAWIRFLWHWLRFWRRQFLLWAFDGDSEPIHCACASKNLLALYDDEAGGGVMVHRMHEPWINWHAMATHESQFVWYRRLFVVFSCYTYVNRIRRYNYCNKKQS